MTSLVTMRWAPCRRRPRQSSRRNEKVSSASCCLVLVPPWSHTPSSVLPHEKVFLEYLPSADQYYKSFMHRDIVNFVVVTRSVAPPRPL